MTIRLHSLRMVNWRSVEDAEIELIQGAPTLLYGDNEAGKSNVLAAIAAFCRLLAFARQRGFTREKETFGWFAPIPSQEDPQDAVRLDNPIRYGQVRASLIGTLLSETQSVVIRFDITNDVRYEVGLHQFRSVVIASVNGSLPPVAPTVLSLGDARTFHEEFLPDPRLGANGYEISPDGAGVKAALFRCANHARPEYRARYHEEFCQLVRDAPFGLPEPIMAFGDARDIQLLFDERPVEERGAGCQEWVLLAGMIAATAPDIALLEEPETNLSWGAQQRFVDLLQRLASRCQLVVATHAPHLAVEGPWYRVKRRAAGSPTTLEPCQGKAGLWQEYGLSLDQVESPSDPRRLTLFPGNVMRLHQPGVEHLGISVGDAVVTSLEEGGVVRMQALERWLGAEDDASE